MADVNTIPKICCDNCGLTVDKQNGSLGDKPSYQKPRIWGSLKIEGGRSTDSYGGKTRMGFTDLCPNCANIALDAAAAALSVLRFT